jgi:amidohydrolase
MSDSLIYQFGKTLQESANQHRRHIHRNPELAFQELETANYVATELENLGFEVKHGFGQTGLVASLAAKTNGPRYLLRFDMDALAVQEQTGLEFASTKEGLMHACGHDGHVAIGLTVAKIISELKAELAGSYHLLFQPAEEIGQGAAAMIADGVLDFIHPDYAMAVHLWAEEPTGWLGITQGPVMAGSKDLRITVHGVGGHSARPHKAVDPILASAHLITALQSIVSRKVDPLDSAVYSITQIHAGSTINVIPDSVTMSGTPRYFTPEVEAEIETSTKRICEGIAKAFGCEIEVNLGVNAPPLVNNPAVCKAAQAAAQKINPTFVIEKNLKMMASEDMALFLQRIPGAMFFVGAGKEDPEKRFPLHHPGFDIDESSLIVAASLLLETCQELSKSTR